MRTLRIGIGCTFLLVFLTAGAWAAQEPLAQGRQMARQAMPAENWATTDHSKHALLQQEFTSGPEVTKACLSCHTEAAAQIHKTIHWTWLDPNADPALQVGKGGLVVNNFCINIQSNEPRCTSCHAGYGWKDKSFDFSDPTKIDCLVCHDQTGTYKKFPTKAGNPVTEPTKFDGKTFLPPDWAGVAQSVGRPGRRNCGTCHFFGGGGDAVKHGDLDSSLMKPNKELDVHMGVDGQNFSCTRCHSTKVHHISGRIYSTPAAESRKSLLEDDLMPRIMCESCHSATPHKKDKLNDHTDKVACQSCHIPEYARVNPTKMWWDWSKAGLLKDGKPYTVDGPLGKHSYVSKKGEFRWEKNVVPEYYWFNGSINTLTAKDMIDPAKTVKVSWPQGARTDPNARIFPFKVHRGKQPYDKVNKTLVIPHLFGKDKSAYWKGFDWKASLTAGMEYAGLPFSGEFDFVETEFVYPTTHMVAPKDKSLNCSACHSKQSRLANLAGFYMPARDGSSFLDTMGWGAVVAALIGVILHGLARLFYRSKRREE